MVQTFWGVYRDRLGKLMAHIIGKANLLGVGIYLQEGPTAYGSGGAHEARDRRVSPLAYCKQFLGHGLPWM